MIVYVLEFDKTRIEFATEQEANEFKAANQIEADVFPFEKVEEIPVWNESAFIAQLSAAFDAKFETYWSAKGYTDISDLLSHAANHNSVYHAEALSLIQWSHNGWEAAIADIDEQSNIQEIINSLQPFE
jgi:hypothetical protein